MTALLEFSDVSRHYVARGGIMSSRRTVIRAVDGVDLTVGPGETVGLVGESGCGKSTLGRLAAGLERPDAGRVLRDGEPAADGSGAATIRPDLIQMIFQDPSSSLNPRLPVGFSVAEGLRAAGILNRKDRRERVMELLGQVGLSAGQAARYPHQFSGGQRQRLAIARALAPGPRLIVCDEPVSALDVSIQAQVLNLLADLRQRHGLAYLFISHDLAVVGHLSDRVAVMYLGKLVELAPTEALYLSPLHPYTRALLAAAPVPDPSRVRPAAIAPGETPSAAAPPSGCAFHPRCPEAGPDCAASPPQWREVAPGRFVRCHAA